ncbi:MAG: fructosamine kinase family protein [Flavobacteriales bacterium]|nr:fructosamine kinase family protein [Flavobacteriales bacterium]
MPLPTALLDQLGQDLERHTGKPVDIQDAVAVGGGSINDCYRLDTDAGSFFVKVDPGAAHPRMFEAEADGLRRLRATGTIRIPDVIAVGEASNSSFLLLEHFEQGTKGPAFWEDLGHSLARMHGHTSASFGLDRDNYIGSLRQSNTACAAWADFFITQRLEPQVKTACDRDRLGAGDALRFEQLYAQVPSLFPAEPPALLHGDLWNGNFLCDASGLPVLIDPAVYYGHREMDIAMTLLFGGFDDAFYDAYNSAWPLETGWRERVDLCNLYPLMVHVNLFGGRYVEQVRSILQRFT